MERRTQIRVEFAMRICLTEADLQLGMYWELKDKYLRDLDRWEYSKQYHRRWMQK
jgi:hypothetical protein